eukprot:gene9263-10241_t
MSDYRANSSEKRKGTENSPKFRCGNFRSPWSNESFRATNKAATVHAGMQQTLILFSEKQLRRTRLQQAEERRREVVTNGALPDLNLRKQQQHESVVAAALVRHRCETYPHTAASLSKLPIGKDGGALKGATVAFQQRQKEDRKKNDGLDMQTLQTPKFGAYANTKTMKKRVNKKISMKSSVEIGNSNFATLRSNLAHALSKNSSLSRPRSYSDRIIGRTFPNKERRFLNAAFPGKSCGAVSENKRSKKHSTESTAQELAVSYRNGDVSTVTDPNGPDCSVVQETGVGNNVHVEAKSKASVDKIQHAASPSCNGGKGIPSDEKARKEIYRQGNSKKCSSHWKQCCSKDDVYTTTTIKKSCSPDDVHAKVSDDELKDKIRPVFDNGIGDSTARQHLFTDCRQHKGRAIAGSTITSGNIKVDTSCVLPKIGSASTLDVMEIVANRTRPGTNVSKCPDEWCSALVECHATTQRKFAAENTRGDKLEFLANKNVDSVGLTECRGDRKVEDINSDREKSFTIPSIVIDDSHCPGIFEQNKSKKGSFDNVNTSALDAVTSITQCINASGVKHTEKNDLLSLGHTLNAYKPAALTANASYSPQNRNFLTAPTVRLVDRFGREYEPDCVKLRCKMKRQRLRRTNAIDLEGH